MRYLKVFENFEDSGKLEAEIKEVLDKAKKIEKISKGVTNQGDKYIIIQYIPNLRPHEFEGGEFTRGVKVFYKDDEEIEVEKFIKKNGIQQSQN